MKDARAGRLGTERTESSSVLVVEADAAVANNLARTLQSNGYSVDIAPTGAAALAQLERATYDALLLDVAIELDWRNVLEAALDQTPSAAVVVLSDTNDVSVAVEAVRNGASDFLTKPVDSNTLLGRLGRAPQTGRRSRRLLPTAEPKRKPAMHVMTAQSDAMRRAIALADRVASTPYSPALLVGESGVGKEVLAERIHEKSARRDGPFIRVNLAALPESVIEAELFGSVRGAFTDSKRDRAGYLASADGGTILLDEIGEFRTEYQAKLLRVIEERRFFPIGSDRERRVNVRILAATNRSPAEMLERGILRQDLYYRLGTVLTIPPLRDRRDEIAPIAREFVRMFCDEFDRENCMLAPSSIEALQQYAWRGNIRELRNVIERAVMMCDGDTILPSHLELRTPTVPDSPVSRPNDSRPDVASLRLGDVRQAALEELERDHILRVLAMSDGSRSRAAEALGVSRSTLYEKLRRYGLE